MKKLLRELKAVLAKHNLPSPGDTVYIQQNPLFGDRLPWGTRQIVSVNIADCSQGATLVFQCKDCAFYDIDWGKRVFSSEAAAKGA